MQTPTTVGQAPALPPPPAPVIVTEPRIFQPLTQRDIESIRERREELSNQLQSAASRRDELADALREADVAARPGIEQRMAVLDQRIVLLEQDIAETGRELTSAPAGLIATTAPPMNDLGGLGPGQVTGISIVFTVLVLFPIALSFARLLWKKATAASRPNLPTEAVVRLQRLEEAVDTVAVEMERVSEGQRFMSRLLAEPNALAALEARQREPVHVGQDRR
ncbi:MAG: hypothetical protein H7Z74_10375 [Anaerolineae bacterium]|nr:hypothetical protein [Gemmatimonadaceae bacterium]